MIKYYYTQAVHAAYPFGFIGTMLFSFFLLHYSIWQKEDDSRSPLPFTELQFFQDFLSHPLHYIDPIMSTLMVMLMLVVLSAQFIESKRILHISDEKISWTLCAYDYQTMVKCSDIQQIEYIQVPPKDAKQILLLRFQTTQSEFDLKLSNFDQFNQQAILAQLAQYAPELLNHVPKASQQT